MDCMQSVDKIWKSSNAQYLPLEITLLLQTLLQCTFDFGAVVRRHPLPTSISRKITVKSFRCIHIVELAHILKQ